MKTALLPLLLLVACAKPAGGPLAHTFDHTKIAAVPLDQKEPVTQAQQRYDLALLHEKTAATTYRESEIEEDLAEHQAKRAVVVSLVVASKQPNAKPAPPTGETAALARKTADAKLVFMQARSNWLEKAAASALYTVYATQARLELERAKVAQANRLTAADFNLDPYQRQLESREQAAKVATDATEAARKDAEAKLALWAELERSYLGASSVSGPLESTRYAAEWRTATSAEAPAPPPPPPPPPS